MLTKGEMLKAVNAAYKLSVCKMCGHSPKRIRRDNGCCNRCMIKVAPIVEGLLLGHRPLKQQVKNAHT